MSFQNIVGDIRSLKIQGADAVAVEASKALLLVINSSGSNTEKDFISELSKAADTLVQTRPTEPAMRNALKFILHDLEKYDNTNHVAEEVKKKVKSVVDHFAGSKQIISEYGMNKIRDGYVVFTHCHSSTVVEMLLAAKNNRIDFEVHNTETRPRFQGRKTAKELSSAGIKVRHYVDSAALYAMKKADICLFGADAIQSDGRVLNKIGTAMFVEIAKKHDIPVYCCSNSWKFDPTTLYGHDEPVEIRDPKEVWTNAPSGVEIINYAFGVIDPVKITAIISELGIYRPGAFADIVQRRYSWLSS